MFSDWHIRTHVLHIFKDLNRKRRRRKSDEFDEVKKSGSLPYNYPKKSFHKEEYQLKIWSYVNVQ
jgi:mRNA-degrading endonuclease RelE of RelBE toxin-antitoxin system